MDSIAETEWHMLLSTKHVVLDVAIAQEDFVEASILVRKWKNQVEHYDSFCQKVVKVFPKLGPSFEGSSRKGAKNLLGTIQWLWSGPIGPFIFGKDNFLGIHHMPTRI
jgi:hypothetical protein